MLKGKKVQTVALILSMVVGMVIAACLAPATAPAPTTAEEGPNRPGRDHIECRVDAAPPQKRRKIGNTLGNEKEKNIWRNRIKIGCIAKVPHDNC